MKDHTKDIKPEVIELVKNMEALSRSIENRRAKNGMLHLELPETELIMDKSGQVVDADAGGCELSSYDDRNVHGRSK